MRRREICQGEGGVKASSPALIRGVRNRGKVGALHTWRLRLFNLSTCMAALHGIPYLSGSLFYFVLYFQYIECRSIRQPSSPSIYLVLILRID